MNNAKPTLLFVCVHNAGRSQLAAGLAASRGGDQVNVLSAGLDPDDKVSEAARASLAEVGIDRSDQRPTKLTDDLVAQADGVVALKPGLDLTHPEGRALRNLAATRSGRMGHRRHPTAS
jgi:arsenate reductase (thioredoxin)